jgi:hypothetical protein
VGRPAKTLTEVSPACASRRIQIVANKWIVRLREISLRSVFNFASGASDWVEADPRLGVKSATTLRKADAAIAPRQPP